MRLTPVDIVGIFNDLRSGVTIEAYRIERMAQDWKEMNRIMTEPSVCECCGNSAKTIKVCESCWEGNIEDTTTS